MNSDIVIIGGGVMGLLAARELAARGATVTLLERGPLAGEASWAGGGIVSPLYPWRYDAAVTALSAASQQAYRELAPALHAASGIDPELRQRGLLMMGVEDSDAALAWAPGGGAALRSIDAAEAARLEPSVRLAPGPLLWMPQVASVRNPRLGQALAGALARNPRVSLHPHLSVSGLETRAGRVVAVRCGSRRISAATVLICAGAWSGELLRPLGVELPIAPVKGQMLLFNTSGGLLERVVLSAGRYLIPRSDGRILVGSTLEQSGFAKQLTAAAHHSLHRSALELLPALAAQPLEAQWAGLRPGSPGGIPFIGAVSGYNNLFINAGHFRNGLVLAPAACRLVAQLITGERPFIDPAPYALDAPHGGELL